MEVCESTKAVHTITHLLNMCKNVSSIHFEREDVRKMPSIFRFHLAYIKASNIISRNAFDIFAVINLQQGLLGKMTSGTRKSDGSMISGLGFQAFLNAKKYYSETFANINRTISEFSRSQRSWDWRKSFEMDFNSKQNSKLKNNSFFNEKIYENVNGIHQEMLAVLFFS